MEKSKFTLYEISDILQHNAVLTMTDNIGKDYGTGDKYTPIEVHTIGYIADHPHCTATDIAYEWGKTTGAVSQIIKKLRAYGMVTAVRNPQDEKQILLNLTEKGVKLDRCHRAYDEQTLTLMFKTLRKSFTTEEIDTAFSVLKTYVEEYCRAKSDLKKKK